MKPESGLIWRGIVPKLGDIPQNMSPLSAVLLENKKCGSKATFFLFHRVS
ncbi:hypothetical protein JMF89_01995 [Clostridiaceae bacterium UIB06]|nr:hypothetical protein [Clostridiaceae bacterium UIB06]